MIHSVFFDRMTVSKLIKLIKLVVLPCNYTQRMISGWLSWFCWLLPPDQPALVMGGALPKPTFGQVSPTMPPTLGHLEDVCFQRQLYRILQMPDVYINHYIYNYLYIIIVHGPLYVGFLSNRFWLSELYIKFSELYIKCCWTRFKITRTIYIYIYIYI